MIEIAHILSLGFHIANRLGLMTSERISATFIEGEGNDRLWQLIEISTQDVGCIVDSVPCPVKSFAIAIGRVKQRLELLDTFCRAA